ncbi:MAG: hypothetical protein J0I77_01045 [Rudaea sp.]|uniref:hypothetical protein n=1 Tax=unclassified Rudaea TaxID=2627037 RepID=UPI0010F7C07A|nr:MULTISPECIES: hypothetical protein [unclassified Rudaea]MBN8884278.1 hypothetical protein [Rudaea sp.]MBR0345309.1 hypothetical protein [Rudaea sp.]
MLKMLMAVLVLLSPAMAFAGGSATGRVSGPWVAKSPKQLFMFYVTPVTGNPSCSTGGRWAVDLSTPSGRATMQLVNFANLIGRTVTVGGTGACTLVGDSEDVDFVFIPGETYTPPAASPLPSLGGT